jgi:hypothetical protein
MRDLKRRTMAVLSIAALFAACDDEENGTTGSGNDAGPPPAYDAGNVVPPDPVADGAAPPVVDSGAKADGEASAAPTVSASVGSTAWIRVADENVVADFFEDDTILRASDGAACVAYVRSLTKAFSAAGTLTVSTAGQLGGLPLPVLIDPGEADNEYFVPFELDGLLFPRAAGIVVQLEKPAFGAFPAMPVQSLKSPAFDKVTVTAPTVPDAGVGVNPTLPIKAGEPYTITWQVPASPPADQRVFVSVFSLFPPAGATHKADVFCSYALSTGQGVIPASLLTEVKSRVGANASGNIHIYAGSQKEVVAGSASYLIEVSRPDSTTIAESFAQLK